MAVQHEYINHARRKAEQAVKGTRYLNALFPHKASDDQTAELSKADLEVEHPN